MVSKKQTFRQRITHKKVFTDEPVSMEMFISHAQPG